MSKIGISVEISSDTSIKDNLQNAGNSFLKLLKSDEVSIGGIFAVEFKDENGQVLTEDCLKHKALFYEVIKLVPAYGSELIYMLKLLELDMEELASDIAWEIMLHARRVKKEWRLWSEQDYIFGADMIYVLAREYPEWSKILTMYFQNTWSFDRIGYSLDLIEALANNNNWSKDLLEAYVRAEVSLVRQRLANSGRTLALYASKPKVREYFNKILVKRLKGKDVDKEEIEKYFTDGGLSITNEQLEQLVVPAAKKVSSQEVKIYVLEKKGDMEQVQLQFLLSTPEPVELKVKVEHPKRLLTEENTTAEALLFNPAEVKKLRCKEESTLWKIDGYDGMKKNIYFPVHEPGIYVIKVLYKGKPIVEERILVEKVEETKVEVSTRGTYVKGSFVPFNGSKNHPFGLKVKINQGRAVAEINHPLLKIETPLKVFERSTTVVKYQNPGEYKLLFDPAKALNFDGGHFEFVLWNKEKTKILYKESFSFEEGESEPLARVKAFGVYGLAKDHQQGVKTSLTPQRLDRKVSVGSYIGVTYSLNNILFKNGSTSIPVYCHVQVKDETGSVIHRDKWPDTAFAHGNNQAVFYIEEGEVFEGHWTFHMTYNNEKLWEQSFPVMKK